jgi:2-C-methyl-D-erythritol 4-phosphate cytidylyltransferase
VIDRSIAAARSVAEGIVVVLPHSAVDLDDHRLEGVEGVEAVVGGGPTRAASVRSGLAAVPQEASMVIVHDAARPLATPHLFERVRDAVLAGAEAVVPAVPVTDTIRQVGGGVVDREQLRAIQTPQGFPAELLRRAHANAEEATDDAGLVERCGGTVTLVEGEPTNLKITGPDDLLFAEALLGRDSRS